MIDDWYFYWTHNSKLIMIVVTKVTSNHRKSHQKKERISFNKIISLKLFFKKKNEFQSFIWFILFNKKYEAKQKKFVEWSFNQVMICMSLNRTAIKYSKIQLNSSESRVRFDIFSSFVTLFKMIQKFNWVYYNTTIVKLY